MSGYLLNTITRPRCHGSLPCRAVIANGKYAGSPTVSWVIETSPTISVAITTFIYLFIYHLLLPFSFFRKVGGQEYVHGRYTMNLQRLICTLVTIAAMALAGCGGGSGGGAMSSIPPAQQPPASTPTPPASTPTPPASTGNTTFANLSSTAATNAQIAASKVANARPRFGSITQSSNAINNITQDRVTVTTEYGATRNTYSVRNGSTWSIGTADGNPRAMTDAAPPFKGSELNKRVNNGTLWVDVYSDIKAPQTGTGTSQPVTVMSGDNVEYTGSRFVLGRGQSTPGELNGQPGTFMCAQTGCSVSFRGGLPNQGSPLPVNTASGITFVSSSGSSGTATVDTDYLSGGIWLFVPDNPASLDDYVFGAFADGSDLFTQSALPALIGTARYVGAATGIYSAREPTSTEIGYFDAAATLTANFGGGSDLGTISGSLTNFEVDGKRQDGTLLFGTANIGSSNSGFFEGSLSGSSQGTSYIGRWGGAFLGNGEADGKPGSVGGTFGGRSTDSSQSFVGVFGAYKQ